MQVFFLFFAFFIRCSAKTTSILIQHIFSGHRNITARDSQCFLYCAHQQHRIDIDVITGIQSNRQANTRLRTIHPDMMQMIF